MPKGLKVKQYLVNEYKNVGLKMPCSYYLTAMGKFALVMYMSEFPLRVSSF